METNVDLEHPTNSYGRCGSLSLSIDELYPNYCDDCGCVHMVLECPVCERVHDELIEDEHHVGCWCGYLLHVSATVTDQFHDKYGY